MFEYLFPIFAFGVVVTGIVCKGLYEAVEEAKTDEALEGRSTERVFSITGDDLTGSQVHMAETNHA